MAELKTKRNEKDPKEFVRNIESEQRRQDCLKLMEIMRQITNAEPKMWGTSIIGFGQYHYKYESGREGDWFLTGFSPRSKALTIYIMPCRFDEKPELMYKLGKYKKGKACLYVDRLSDIDSNILKKLIRKSVRNLKETYGN